MSDDLRVELERLRRDNEELRARTGKGTFHVRLTKGFLRSYHAASVPLQSLVEGALGGHPKSGHQSTLQNRPPRAYDRDW